MKSPTILMTMAAVACLAGPALAEDYSVDSVHSGASFRASHVGLAWLPGQFKEVSGTFSIDSKNPAGSHFDLSAKVDSIDTNNQSAIRT